MKTIAIEVSKGGVGKRQRVSRQSTMYAANPLEPTIIPHFGKRYTAVYSSVCKTKEDC